MLNSALWWWWYYNIVVTWNPEKHLGSWILDLQGSQSGYLAGAMFDKMYFLHFMSSQKLGMVYIAPSDLTTTLCSRQDWEYLAQGHSGSFMELHLGLSGISAQSYASLSSKNESSGKMLYPMGPGKQYYGTNVPLLLVRCRWPQWVFLDLFPRLGRRESRRPVLGFLICWESR